MQTRPETMPTQERRTPEPQRISPPSGAPWRSAKFQQAATTTTTATTPITPSAQKRSKKDYFGSSEHLQKLLEEQKKSEPEPAEERIEYSTVSFYSIKKAGRPSERHTPEQHIYDTPPATNGTATKTPTKRAAQKQYFGSSEHLSKLLDDSRIKSPTSPSPVATKAQKHKDYFGSSEHLQVINWCR